MNIMAGLIVLPTHSSVGLVCLVKEDRELYPNTSDSRLLYRDGLHPQTKAQTRGRADESSPWALEETSLLGVCTPAPGPNVAS